MSTIKILAAFYEKMGQLCRENNLTAGKSGRHMIFPYTISAKIAQFPLFYYLKHNWIWMYYPPAIITTFLVVILKIHRAVNSTQYKKTWAETQRQMEEKEREHH